MLIQLTLVFALAVSTEASSWSYADADIWGEQFPTCQGSRQSPIDIVDSALLPDLLIPKFKFYNFDSSANVATTMVNNGHTVQVTYTSGDLRVSGGGLSDQYSVLQYHFHWGSVDTQGSEHTVNGQSYPMEMHIVNWNRKYGNVSNALNHGDGLAVLGFFFEISNEDNAAFTPIVKSLSGITAPGSTCSLQSLILRDLLPANLKRFYRYDGGLTTPGCNEIVIWTVFKDTIPISSNQLAAFRSLQSSDEDQNGNPLPLQDNFRPVQDLAGRIIKVTFDPLGTLLDVILP